MRLVVLTAAYPSPAEPERAIFLEELHRALEREAGGDLRTVVIAPRVHAADPLREQRGGIEVRRFRYPSGGRRLKERSGVPWGRLGPWAAGALVATWRELRREADLLCAHWVLPSGPVGALAARWTRRPFVLFAHGSDLCVYGRRGLGRRLAGRALRRADRVFAVSRELAALCQRPRHAASERVEVLPMGVASHFTPGERVREREQLGLGRDLELLYVGDLIESKGVLELLDALGRLGGSPAAWRLHLVGTGPLRARIARWASGAGERVVLHGRLSQRELAGWYRAVDLLVHPSWSEGSPLAVMEALSSGLPVLASSVGGIPDLVSDGETGRLVSARDPAALSAALGELVDDRGPLMSWRQRLAADPPEHHVAGRARALWPRLEEIARREA